mgnify:CR=1 FL=1
MNTLEHNAKKLLGDWLEVRSIEKGTEREMVALYRYENAIWELSGKLGITFSETINKVET